MRRRREHKVSPFDDPECKVLFTMPRDDGGVVYVMSRRSLGEVLQSYADSTSVPLGKQFPLRKKVTTFLTETEQ